MSHRSFRPVFLAPFFWIAALSVLGQTPTLPVATPSPTTVAQTVGKQTIESLKGRIAERLLRPELRRGHIGVKIVSLNSNKVVFESNAEKYFVPASNMKNFTVAAALERLTPDFRFVTSVYAVSLPDASGTIMGDLRIFGRGDVSISTRFTDGDYYRRLDDLADKIVQAGVKRIEGGIIGDETYFSGDPINATWEVEDLETPDGVEISALPINDNAVDISVQPGLVGYQCTVRVTPPNPIMRVVNRCTSSARGTTRTLRVTKKLDQNILEITGKMPVGDSPYTESIAISRPSDLFVALLKQRLETKGVTITGTTRSENQKSAASPIESVEIAKLESPPLSVIAAMTMKPSQNMYTETLLWTLGEEARRIAAMDKTVPGGTPLSSTSVQLGLASVKKVLEAAGIAPDSVVQYDGSGMSRRDLITPGAVIRLYAYMAKQSKYSQVWRDSLAVGGVDGTLRNRFARTLASGNLRGKTGTLSQVSALSGYISTKAGESLVFSIIVNGVPEQGMRTSLIDDIVVQLANFDGRID